MIPNAIVNGLHLNSSERFYESREMQVDAEGPLNKVMDLDVSVLERIGYDWPESIWVKGDTVQVIQVEGVPGVPADNPFHVTRVLPQGLPVPMKILGMARIDSLQTAVLWLERITYGTTDPNVPNGTSSEATGYDPARQDEAALSDESYGSGYNTSRYHGYFPAKGITIGLLERQNLVDIQQSGVAQYEEAEFVYEGPNYLKNEDVIVLPDGRRGTVSRRITTIQINGVAIGTLYGLSIHNQGQGTRIYDIPVTQ